MTVKPSSRLVSGHMAMLKQWLTMLTLAYTGSRHSIRTRTGTVHRRRWQQPVSVPLPRKGMTTDELLSGGIGTRPKNVSDRPIMTKAVLKPTTRDVMVKDTSVQRPLQARRTRVVVRYVSVTPDVGLVMSIRSLLCPGRPRPPRQMGIGPVKVNIGLLVVSTSSGRTTALNGLTRPSGPSEI